ncbi:hypothetical protein N7535_008155 [Penicillium sp. DV-2018c]|nr:hypothetical protein N7461_004192 [Penicillium sp. DV-2018c]KAJ5566517.1 hypothetical protein N7535_008155 [Penicillium sp. DV-2018c]
MHFSQKVIAVMATLMTLGLAADPLSFTSWPKDPLEPGKPITLTWTGAAPDHPVTILLRKGPSGNLKDVKAITDAAKDGSFTWTPDDDVKRGQTYAFEIRQDDQVNYTALLKSAAKPAVEVPPAQEATTDAHDTTAAATGTTTAPSTQSTGSTTQATQATETTPTSTGSRTLISSSATPSGSPSSSAIASSSDSDVPTGTEIINNQEPSPTDIVSTGDASAHKYSVQLVLGVVGVLAYLV